MTNQTGVELYSVRFWKPPRMEMTQPPRGKHYRAWLLKQWKRFSLSWSRWEKKHAGNEVPTRCCRQFIANLDMLVSLFTRAEDVSYKSFHSSHNPPGYLGHSPSNRHDQANSDSWHSLFSLYSCLFCFSLYLALKQRKVLSGFVSGGCPAIQTARCLGRDVCPTDPLETLPFTSSVR